MNDDHPIVVRDLTVSFGVIEVLRGVSFSVARQSALAIVGDNGAGKSTILLALAGGLEGATVAGGISIEGSMKPHHDDVVARRKTGISIVPEREKVFSLLTVKENLRSASTDNPRDKIRPDDILEFFPALASRRTTLAGNLSGGEQQMLAIGMSLLGNPKILLIDEPTLGLSVPVIEKLCETLAAIRKDLALTVLIAESEEQWINRLADDSIKLERGCLVDRSLRARDVSAGIAGRQTTQEFRQASHA